jgi:sugar lactone lactonase YvrE
MASTGDSKLFMMKGGNLLTIDLTSGAEALATVDVSDFLDSATGSKTVQGIAADATNVYITCIDGKVYTITRGGLAMANGGALLHTDAVVTGKTAAGSGHPTGIVVDSSGNVYYLDGDAGNGGKTHLYELAHGAIVKTNVLANADGKYLAIDSTGKKFYISDTTGNKVVKVTIP